VDIEALAQELGRTVHEADVRAAADRSPAIEAEEPAVQSRNEQMRSAIAKLMGRSKREIPHYYLALTTDIEAPLVWMRARNLELSVAERLLPAALLLKATALAAAETPTLNGYWIDHSLQPADTVNLGMAISLRGGGLVTPCIHDAAALGLTDLMAAVKDLTQRARAGRLRGSELTDGTITVTNLGEQGVDLVHGVIYPPQVALVGIGRPAVRPWVVDGRIEPRQVVDLTLAADHRASDGFTGSRFLDRIAHHLNQPEEL
jgi:pyruvate dehydrogenase E2 component (dihydrolipoamide acetyltransferase)